MWVEINCDNKKKNCVNADCVLLFRKKNFETTKLTHGITIKSNDLTN